MPARDVRDRFVRAEGIYLLSHSVGLAPANAAAVLQARYLDHWSDSDRAWPNWLAEIDRFRTELAGLLGGSSADICPQVNLSSGLTKLLQGLPPEPGRDLLLHCDQDFPSMGYVLQQATRCGYRLQQLPADADSADPGVWAEAMSGGVRAVLVTHVHSNTSRLSPVAEICRMARDRGILSIVDVAQSAGCVPIHLPDWRPDFVLGSCVKWLCGGPGAGWLWADPEISAQCRPSDVGWFSHEEPFEFDIHAFRYAPGANRFWGGTPSVAPYVLAANSIALVREIGVTTIREHNRALAEQLLEVIDPAELAGPAEAEARGGTLVLDLGERQPAVAQRLAEAGVLCDGRATGLRLSPHIYNTAAEAERVRECLAP